MKSAILFAALLSTLALTACGPSKAELEEQRLREEIEFNSDPKNMFIQGWTDENKEKGKDAPAAEVNDKSNEVKD